MCHMYVYVMIVSSMIANFLNCSLLYKPFFSNLDLIAASQYHEHVIIMNFIIRQTIYVLVARDFYSNGRPVVALATNFALVSYFIVDITFFLKCTIDSTSNFVKRSCIVYKFL